MSFVSRSAGIALFGAGRVIEMIRQGSFKLTEEDADILKDIIFKALEEARASGQEIVIKKLAAAMLQLRDLGVC